MDGLDPLGAIQRLGSGHLIEDLHFAIAEIAGEVVRTGNPGDVTLSLHISKVKGSPAVTIIEAIKRSPPKESPRGSMYYAFDGMLHEEDPRQKKMDFRTVESPDSEIRRADEERAYREVAED